MELINKFIDRTAGGSDFSWAIDNMGKLEKRIDDLNGKSISIELNLKTDNATLEKVLQNTIKLHEANEKLLESTQQLSAHKKVLGASSKVVIDHDKRMVEITKQLNKEREKTKQLLAKLDQQMAAMEAREKASARTQRTKEQQKAEQDRIKWAEKAIAAKKKLAAETERLDAVTAKELAKANEADRAYNKLNATHVKLLKSARDVGVVFGHDSVQFLKAAAAANEAGDKLKAVDAKLGQHTRNVGNYTSAWNGLNYSIGNLVSELPNLAQSPEIFFRAISNNILPIGQQIQQVIDKNKLLAKTGQQTIPVWKSIASAMLGWQTLLIVGVTLMVAYGDEITKLITGSKKLINAQSALNDVYEGLDTSFAKTGAELENLQKQFFSSSASAEEKDKIVRRLNKDYGDVAGAITTWKDAERFFIDQAPAYVEAMKQRAIADASYQLIAKNSIELLKEENKTASEAASGWDKFIAGAQALTRTNPFGAESYGSVYDHFLTNGTLISGGAIRQSENNRMKLKKELTEFEKLAAEAEKTFGDIVGKYNFNFEDKKDPKPKKDPKHSELLGMRKKLNDELVQADLDMWKAIIATEQKAQQDIFQNDDNSGLDRVEARWKYHNLVLQLLEKEEQAALAKNANEYNNNKAVIEKSTADVTVKNELLALENMRYEKETYSLGMQYAEKKAQSLAHFADEGVKDMEDAHEKNLSNIKRNLDSMSDYFKINGKLFSESYDSHFDKLKNSLKEIIDLMGQFGDIGKNIAAVVYDPQIAAQDQIINNLRSRHDLEIAVIKSTSATEEEANRRIAEYEAQIYIAQQAAEREKIRLKIKAAEIDKAANISKIIGATALAVITAYTEGDPFTKVARSIIAGIAGAAQLAAAVAAPLPQYWKGVKHSPAGWAEVGEKGYEMRINPDGSKELTPNSSTYTYLEKGTQIVPHHETKELLAGAQHSSVSTTYTKGDDSKYFSSYTNKVIKSNENNTNKIVKQLRKNNTQPPAQYSTSGFNDRVINKYKG